eukprot:1151621-Rhodomonas_salina.3
MGGKDEEKDKTRPVRARSWPYPGAAQPVNHIQYVSTGHGVRGPLLLVAAYPSQYKKNGVAAYPTQSENAPFRAQTLCDAAHALPPLPSPPTLAASRPPAPRTRSLSTSLGLLK